MKCYTFESEPEGHYQSALLYIRRYRIYVIKSHVNLLDTE